MNYALDALWWRLRDPDVRALATILTAPALWHSGFEMPAAGLLGTRGFRFLLALDEKPGLLKAHLAKEAPFGGRLGVYAESLLAFWLAHAPHTGLLARNLPVSGEDGRTLGALDYVARIDGELCHIELTCKYYGSPQALPHTLTGLNRRDGLVAKAAKLTRQLALSQSKEGRAALSAAGVRQPVRPVSVVRGMGFSGQGSLFDMPPLNPLGWHGFYWVAGEDFPFGGDAPFYILPHMAWLAPARVGADQCCGKTEIGAAENVLFAVMEKRPDGMMHETARIMKAGPVREMPV